MGESSWKEQRRGLNNSPLQLHSRDVKQILCQRSWLFAVNNHLSIFLFILSLLLYLSSLKHPIASITQVTLVTLVISVTLYEDCNATFSKHRNIYHITQRIHVPRRPYLYFRILAHHLLFNTKLCQLCHSEQKHCYPWRICEFIGVQSKSEYLANVRSVTGRQDEDKGVVIQHSLLPTGPLSAQLWCHFNQPYTNHQMTLCIPIGSLVSFLQSHPGKSTNSEAISVGIGIDFYPCYDIIKY